jgi:hypothetical protein
MIQNQMTVAFSLALILIWLISVSILNINNIVFAQVDRQPTARTNNDSDRTQPKCFDVPTSSMMIIHVCERSTNSIQRTTYSANGEITSQAAKFILAGLWSLDVKGGNVTHFIANFTAVLPDGTRLHYHTFSNFHQTLGSISQLDANNSGSIHGTMDVGVNNRLNEWPQVPTIISIKNGTTISIVLNDASRFYPPPPVGPLTSAFAHFTDLTNHAYNTHTGSQPIYGIVKQLIRTHLHIPKAHHQTTCIFNYFAVCT